MDTHNKYLYTYSKKKKEQKDALHTHRERKNYICQLVTKWKGQQKQMEYIHFECVCVDNPKMKLGQSSISFKCIPTEKESVGEIQEKSVGKKRCEE